MPIAHKLERIMQERNDLIDTILDIGRACLLQRQGMSTEADISQVDFAVIDLLQAGEKISCKDLSESMDLSSSRCSRIVERLQKKGYVERKQNCDDRRAVEVSLTSKGIELKKGIGNLKRQCEKRILSTMNPDEVEIVEQGITILRKSLRIRFEEEEGGS